MAKKPSSNAADSKASKKAVVALTHEDAKRKNIPTAEFQPVMAKELQSPIRVAYERRNRDLDPQLVWRGKDDQDWSDLVVPAPPLFIQEKVHPKALIDDLRRQTDAAEIARKLVERKGRPVEEQIDLFADFNGLPDDDAKTEFYQHDAHWANRMILGDSLQVMASLAEREGLRGQVQCIYFDPPYGIEFNSNFQWSTTSRAVDDGKVEHITREPEQVKAFRDTWRDGIHSYLTYVRDRLTVARDLMCSSGSCFLQIGEQNVHRLRSLMDEVFSPSNFCALILVKKKGGQKGRYLESVNDYILWYFKDKPSAKPNPLFEAYNDESEIAENFRLVKLSSGDWSSIARLSDAENVGELYKYKPLLVESKGHRLFKSENSTSGGVRKNQSVLFRFQGEDYDPGLAKGSCWKHTAIDTDEALSGMQRLAVADRLYVGRDQIGLVRYYSDFGHQPVSNWWDGFGGPSEPIYVVQTNERIVERCLLMATNPGDLVLDPTCGSGTTATVAEQWGRRWITIDTSRVSLALARARLMAAKYPYYLLLDSQDGKKKDAEVSRREPSSTPTRGSLRLGFVNRRAAHITSSVVANNAEIDVLWKRYQARLEPLRATLNRAVGTTWEEWEIPREVGEKWSKDAKEAHARWWEQRIQRQKEIDASIAAKAEFEYLYDKPYEDKKKVRVAGPFTVESLSPHRTLGVDENDDLIDPLAPKDDADTAAAQDFAAMVLENLKAAGVQQADKKDRIAFSSLSPWPGRFICAEGRYAEGESTKEKRAAIFIGPEFGTVSRQDLVVAAREAGDADFDVLIACAFNYEAHASEFNKLGRIPVLKARMNAELHMGSELKTTGKGNLFVIFGEPDIEVLPPEEAPKGAKVKDYTFIRVKINGVDVFHPQTGEVRSDGAEGIACWFIDTDYNEESFFVRQAYFLGANDPYKALKTTLKAEINEEAWATLRSDTSREFAKPKSGKIAVKVINHLGDEVMKVFTVE
jgi:adenine-specific DNA-methyltransferase